MKAFDFLENKKNRLYLEKNQRMKTKVFPKT